MENVHGFDYRVQKQKVNPVSLKGDLSIQEKGAGKEVYDSNESKVSAEFKVSRTAFSQD